MTASNPMDRSELEREAELARARLANTLSALDRRRHEVMNVGRRIEQQVLPVAAVGAAALVGVAGAIGVALYGAAKNRRRKKGRERVRALGRLWSHPEQVVRQPPRRSVLVETARRTTIAVASYLAVRAVRYLIEQAGGPAVTAALAPPIGSDAQPIDVREDEPSRVATRFPVAG